MIEAALGLPWLPKISPRLGFAPPRSGFSFSSAPLPQPPHIVFSFSLICRFFFRALGIRLSGQLVPKHGAAVFRCGLCSFCAVRLFASVEARHCSTSILVQP
jgi:hypothetical protein